MLRFYLFRFIQLLVNILPVKVVYCLSDFFADIKCASSSKSRNAVTRNLRRIGVKDFDSSKNARMIFRNFGRYFVEFLRSSRNFNKEFIDQNVDYRSIQCLDEALNKKKGCLIVSAHMGNWEMGAMVLGILGYKVSVVTHVHPQREVNDFFDRTRNEKGVGVIHGKDAPRRCLEVLKANECVAIMSDHVYSRNGEVVKFFGQNALFPKGAALFSLKTGAPIIPTFLLRNDNGTFRLWMGEMIEPPVVEKPTKQDIVTLMQCYVSVVESVIRQNPLQWTVFQEPTEL